VAWAPCRAGDRFVEMQQVVHLAVPSGLLEAPLASSYRVQQLMLLERIPLRGNNPGQPGKEWGSLRLS
jgi:hypothetical protein